MRRTAAALVALAGLSTAPGSAAAPAEPQSLAPTATVSWTARGVVPMRALSRPGGGRVRYRFATEARYNGGPVALLVLDRAQTADGVEWLKVLVPRRPNGSTGWVRRDRVALRRNPWRVAVSRRARRIELFRSGRRVGRWRVVIGAPATPTPRGLFAVNEVVRQPSPGAFVGSWVLHLTGFSNVLDNYGGGPGRIGLHGRGGASLADPLGSARSHGCIRMDNRMVALLAARAREGTPVRIR